jgi:hypothetical protein
MTDGPGHEQRVDLGHHHARLSHGGLDVATDKEAAAAVVSLAL